MKKITIAIDGFSSTGKSTLAKQIAKQLHYIYVDTGAMYRAITYYAIQNQWIDHNKIQNQKIIDNLPNIKLEFIYNPNLGYSEIYLNQVNVEKQIRTLQVSDFVSKIAEISQVRAMLVEQQKEIGKNKAIVMDGRDIGTVVFPDAELKIFMTASAQTRAQRRYIELQAIDPTVTYTKVLQNIEERDYIDTHREDSPLVKAKDAILIDNSHLTITEQFNKVLELYNNLD